MLAIGLAAHAQEAGTKPALPVLPDTVLHLPALNAYGQMPYVGYWPATFGGWYDWRLHQGLNLSLGASVFGSFDKHAPSGAGFSENVSGMYAWSLTPKLSLAAGGYFVNTDWGGWNVRDAGLSAVIGYRFDRHWEAYIYGQKSLVQPKVPLMMLYDMQELGDRIGAAVRYNFSPSFSVQLSVEERRGPSSFPHYSREIRP